MATAIELFAVVFPRLSDLPENRGDSVVTEGNVFDGGFFGRRIGGELNKLLLGDSV